MTLWFIPSFNISFISRACFSFIFALPCLDPIAALPLFLQSRVFSSLVPADKWIGFTHSGVSQECVNPIHLSAGTRLLNTRDKWIGFTHSGVSQECIASSKLTDPIFTASA